jgi:hypothetical protein
VRGSPPDGDERRRKREHVGMGRIRSRLVGLACIAGALTLAITMGVALGAKLKQKSASVTIASETNRSVTATCKQGQKAISGGFEQPDFDPAFNAGAFQFYESRREAGREWTASAANYGDGSGTLVSYAYCLDAKRLKERSGSVLIPGFTGAESPTGTATATCKAGEKVIAGGFDNGDFVIEEVELLAYSSHKQGKRSWSASAVNYDNDPGTLTAYAYCREGKGTKSKSDEVTIAEFEVGSATARCKKRQKLVSGGFDAPDFGPDFVGDDSQILPHVSMKTGKRKWTASGFGNATGEAGTFTAYAYCEKKTKR